MSIVRLKIVSIEGTAHELELDFGCTWIAVHTPFKFEDSSTREKYELGWHHLTDAQILQEGQDPEALKGAAAGALVGFLLAGPLGTAAGGLMGAGRQDKRDPLVGFSFDDGRTIVASCEKSELQNLRSLCFALRNVQPEKEKEHVFESLADMTKVCPGCIEDIHLKATRCKHCGMGFDLEGIKAAIDLILLKEVTKSAYVLRNNGIDWPVNTAKIVSFLQRQVACETIQAFNLESIEAYLEEQSRNYFERVVAKAASSAGLEKDSIYMPLSSAPDIEEFMGAWESLATRMPNCDSLSECYADYDNWGIIFLEKPSDPTAVAKGLSLILLEGSFGAAHSIAELTAANTIDDSGRDGFGFINDLPSRLATGDEELTYQLVGQLIDMGFIVHPDPYCLQMFPGTNTLEDRFDLTPDAVFDTAREQYAQDIGLEGGPKSYHQKRYEEDVKYLEEDFYIIPATKEAVQETDVWITPSSDNPSSNPTTSSEAKDDGFFKRLLKAIAFGALNFSMIMFFYSAAAPRISLGILLLLMAWPIVIGIRVINGRRWDYWMFIALFLLSVISIVMSLSGTPMTNYFPPCHDDRTCLW